MSLRYGKQAAWGIALLAASAAVAGAQQVTTGAQISQRSSSGGLLGQPAALPNVFGRNRSLPHERAITLPGLP
ncbi:MAG: hypothetical protein K8E66_02735, partial [Phycisphaerales bacterium]|nr:hypothetical protein [Phycisphaerales bacterium]